MFTSGNVYFISSGVKQVILLQYTGFSVRIITVNAYTGVPPRIIEITTIIKYFQDGGIPCYNYLLNLNENSLFEFIFWRNFRRFLMTFWQLLIQGVKKTILNEKFKRNNRNRYFQTKTFKFYNFIFFSIRAKVDLCKMVNSNYSAPSFSFVYWL